jgi:hypothetical protein
VALRTRRLKWILIVASCLLAGVLVWFAQVTRRTDEAIGDWLSYSQALLRYATDHDGVLPRSAEALLNDGYCSKDRQGGWEVLNAAKSNGSVKVIGRVRHPEWFDVAWGTGKDGLADDGRVVSQNRALIRPAKNTRYASSFYKGLSAELARSIKQLHATTAPTLPGAGMGPAKRPGT